ncbi:hypothetical protein [Paenibacillus sp. FSL K6-2524]|uniref:hypothetical protein n=1 Tax=Paenibacillus sp. FSL K6-2524 TaxID=2954516 RepID=UPI0030F9C20C
MAEGMAGAVQNPASMLVNNSDRSAKELLMDSAIGFGAGLFALGMGGYAIGKGTGAGVSKVLGKGNVPDSIVIDGIGEVTHISTPNLPEGSQWERNVLNSFAAGKSEIKIYGEGTTLYRVGDKNGGFWSLDPPPATEFEWRINTAIKQEWVNNASNLYEITIPNGSSITGLDGRVGSQGIGLYGGGHQTYIDFNSIPESWIKITPLK